MPYRIGIGYDIHRMVEGRPLVLGGVTIAFSRGLLGHSDGDVIVHAVCDALLGACALSDIGVLFPDTAEETKDMYSLDMLTVIREKIIPDFSMVNIDINCICEQPRLGKYRDEMIANIAKACTIDLRDVSVKFRTHEGLGEIGAGEAVAAQAVVLVKKNNV